MKQLIQSLINEINAEQQLEYYLILKNECKDIYRIDFINKIDNRTKAVPVVGNLLHLQYYLMGMLKYKYCLPF